MGLAAEKLMITPEDYLEGEKHSDVKHQYINGDVYAMSGTSDAHNGIALNLAGYLNTHLRATTCRVFMESVKARIQTVDNDQFFYPDIQVTCDETDNERYFKTQAKLIIEILSPSTERYDRAEKFYAYRQLESLQEYVLIAQDSHRVEVYRRRTQWELELYGEDQDFYLESVDLKINVADVYEQIDFIKDTP